MAKRILLADDSITIQKVVELTFSDGDYEVTAVNNGTKAIQKLSEMRPDIILSDIIMPEKNGYEVCEFVKSHPEFRTIPVVLLTGTFEPFDPDRADKAGCDAVVTKPFESQSLIQKVEELIGRSQSAGASSSPAAAPSQPADMFGGDSSPAPQAPASETPFDFSMPTSGETKAFPKVSFDDLKRMAAESAAPPAPPSAPAPSAAPPPPAAPAPAAEASPWDEPSTAATQAFPVAAFEELKRAAMSQQSEPAAEETPAPAQPEASSPWDEPPATSGETKAFPKMSLEELRQMASPAAQAPEPEPPMTPAPSLWDSAPAESSAAHENVTPFEPPSETLPPQQTSAPWDEAPPSAGETLAFPRMTFEDIQRMESQGQPVTARQPEPAPEPESAPAPAPAEAAAEEVPFTAPQPEPMMEPEAEEPAPTAPMFTHEPAAEAAPAASAAEPAAHTGDLSDEQIDRIARRVVQLMSDHVVKNIAWEVIPDLAEMVVKERIRQLENEA